MDFFRKLLGMPERFHEKVPQESSNGTVIQKTPVPPFLAEKFPWLENAFRIRENDCASCKYIGSGLSYSICIFILSQIRSPPKEAIKRKVPFYIAVASMSTSFFVLGTCRLFDIGFSAPQADDEIKTFSDFLNEDIETLKKFVNDVTRTEVFKPSMRSIMHELEKLEKEKEKEKERIEKTD